MTLPIDIILPLRPEQIKSGDPADLELYMRDLVNSLTDMYQSMVQNIDGTLQQYTPTIRGSVTAGTGTYTAQTGWYLRQGIIVDVWFDIVWTAHTGTGNAIITLPYKVAKSPNSTLVRPFAGTLGSSVIPFAAGYTSLICEAEPDTFNCNGIEYGSGVPFINTGVTPVGRYIGHVRYPGQEFS